MDKQCGSASDSQYSAYYRAVGLKNTREKKGLTQKELAEKLWPDSNRKKNHIYQISCYENFRYNMTFKTANRLCKILDCALQDIVEQVPQKCESGKNHSTKCWECALAYGGSKCPWINSGNPVPGWKAKERIIKTKSNIKVSYYQTTYCVLECPLYREGRVPRFSKPITSDGFKSGAGVKWN